MAKKKEEHPVMSEMSPYMKSMVLANNTRFGEKDGKMHMGSQIDDLVVGLPLPSLALMYLFDSTVLPLGKSIIFAGRPASQKSSMGFEVARWFCDAGGYGNIAECEGNKVSPSLVKSVVGSANYPRVGVTICQTVDEARQRVAWNLNYMNANDKDKTIPFAQIWDSLSGATTETTADKVMGDEEMSARGYPENAL